MVAQALKGFNNLRVLDYAIVPTTPVKPRTSMIIAIAFFFGLLGGIALALLLDALDVSVKGQQDLERMGLVFLGLVPSINEAINRYKRNRNTKKKNVIDGDEDPVVIPPEKISPELVVHQLPKSTVAESCRVIRTNLLFMSPERELRTLLVTSPGPQEGKTTVAISLAIVMAQGGSRVVLIDLDMRRPRVHQPFGFKKEPGMSEAILGKRTIDEIVRSTDIKGLWIIPSGPVPPNPAELLHTERFSLLLRELSEKFDRVVIDSPPLGPVTDAAIISTQVDGVVMVAKSGATRRAAIKAAWRQLKEIGARVLGTVLNNVSAKRSYGYYNYYYYRKRGYGYYAYGEEEGRQSRQQQCAEPSQDLTPEPAAEDRPPKDQPPAALQ